MNLRTGSPPKRTSSGNHPAVREFRRKLQSVGDGADEKLTDLDAQIEEYLRDVKSDPPPSPRRG